METVKFPQRSFQVKNPILGFHGMPNNTYLIDKSCKVDRKISGVLDKDFFAYLMLEVINPENGNSVISVKAIIDTGASTCLIKEDIADYLQLKPIGKTNGRNPLSGITEGNDYLIDLIFESENREGGAKVTGVRVFELKDKDYPCGLIIGAEFLRICNFNYNGTEKTFELHIKTPSLPR